MTFQHPGAKEIDECFAVTERAVVLLDELPTLVGSSREEEWLFASEPDVEHCDHAALFERRPERVIEGRVVVGKLGTYLFLHHPREGDCSDPVTNSVIELLQHDVDS